MDIPQIKLSHSNADEDWRMTRLENLLLSITEKLKFAVHLNGFWIKSINDHKGAITFEWNIYPPVEFIDLIGETWETEFLENRSNIMHNKAW